MYEAKTGSDTIFRMNCRPRVPSLPRGGEAAVRVLHEPGAPDLVAIARRIGSAGQIEAGRSFWRPGKRRSRLEHVTQDEAEAMARRLALDEGIFGGISSGAAAALALRVAAHEEHATIVFMVCDRGDRYVTADLYRRNQDKLRRAGLSAQAAPIL